MNDSCNSDNMWKNNSILILNPIKYEETKSLHDFSDFSTKIIANSFSKSYLFYFYNSILINGIKKTETQIKNLIKENNISVVFFAPHGTNYELPVELFKDLRDELKVKNVLWVLDDEIIFDTLSKYYAQVFDAVITNDYYATFAYQKLGLPSLCFFYSCSNKDNFYPVAIDKDIDVGFIGDCTKADRMEYINFLKENGIRVKTFGKGSENGIVKKEKLPEIFSRTKINLNFTKVNTASIYTWFLEDNPIINLVRQNKGRSIEIAMTNSFCLSEYFPSLKIIFEIGKEIAVFYDKNDLLEKIKFYLENEDVRIQIANNAYQKATNIYEVNIFIPKVLENLCNLLSNYQYLPKEAKIYKNSIFKKNHINQLTFIMFYQLLKLKFRPALETFINLFQYGFGIFLISFFKGTKRAILRMYYEIAENLQTVLAKKRLHQ